MNFIDTTTTKGNKMNKVTNLLNMIAEELNTTDKNLVISVAMSALVKSGAEVDVAFELLFGEGAWKKFAGNLYDALRAKAATA
jgi:hypothetical protein